MQRPIGAPRFLLDENAGGPPAGGAGDGGGAGVGDKGAGAGAANAGDAGGSGAKPGDAAGGGQPGGDGKAPSPYRPEGLPDHLIGKDDRDTLDKVFKAFDGFRRGAAEQGTVPDKPEAYTFEASDKLKPYVDGFDKDPVYNAARGIAQKSGMTDKVFKAFMPALLEHFVDGGLVEAPMDAKVVLRGLAPANMANATDAEKEVAGGRRVTENVAWVDQMKSDKTMPTEAADYLASQAADNPGAHALIDWMRGNRQEARPALAGGNAAGAPTKADLDLRVADPRNDPNSMKFEKAFAEKTREMFKAANP